MNISNNNNKINTSIVFLNLLIGLFLFKTAIPLLKYPFLFLYLGFLLSILISYRREIPKVLKEFLLNYYFVLILLSIIIFSAVLSDKLYLLVVRDLVNILLLITLFIISSFFIRNIDDIKLLFSKLINLVIIFSSILSVLFLLDSLKILTYKQYFPNNRFLNNAIADTINIDTNFVLVPVFFGIISVFYILQTTSSKIQKVAYNSILLLFSMHICFSGSRRGLAVLVVICILLFFLRIDFISRKIPFLRTLASNSGAFLLEIFIIILLSYLFVFHTSFKFKDSSLKFLGINNDPTVKADLSYKIYRYVSAYNFKISSYDLNKLIWSIKLDPRDPDTGWGKGNYRKIYPLNGKNKEIVPFGSIGYLLDSTCFNEASPDHVYSYSMIGRSYVDFNDILESAVYCYVSDDFNGDRVSLYSEGATYGQTSREYDLNKKSTWQKLSILANCKRGEAPTYLYFAKSGVTKISLLRGYVIFAYPTYTILNKTRLSLYPLDNTEFINTNKKSVLSAFNNISFSRSTSEKQSDKKNTSDFLNKIIPDELYKFSNHSRTSTSLIFENSHSDELMSFPGFILINNLISYIESDPIKNRLIRLVAEDTTYHPCKVYFKVDTVYTSFTDQRTYRWQFAWQLFTREYTWSKKLFGGGFNFLNWYGNYFLGNKTKSDYPHNPFLHILLYSGILGLSIYLLFLYKAFYFYLKYIKEYPLFFIFFLITFFFTFFSGGNPFDPPIMGFFVILPFFIHSVHKRQI